jgi:hypothetical protein
MRRIASFFLIPAFAGFLTTSVIHICALAGFTAPFEATLRVLFPGIFIVAFPTIFVMNWLARDFKQKDIWRAALRGCPAWMRRAVWVIFGYVWATWLLFPMLYGGGMHSASNTARAMSGVAAAFYLIPAAVMFSATRAERIDKSRRCGNGHLVSPLAKFCEECGAAVTITDNQPGAGMT